jgi:hypothetical protein
VGKSKRKDKPTTALPSGILRLRKNPTTFALEHPVPSGEYVRILGVDLGRNCGIAICDLNRDKTVAEQLIVAGIWDLSIGPYDTGPIRHLRLRQFLAVTRPDLISYENVKYTPAVGSFQGKLSPAVIVARAATAQEFLGGLKVTLTTWAEGNGVPVQSQDIGSIKKFATGSGVASKLDMIKAANREYGVRLEESSEEAAKAIGDDNVADAIFCCAMGVQYYADGLRA